MATKKKAVKAGKQATINASAYAKRVLEDEELRRLLADAYKSSRHAYGRMRRGKKPTDALMHDRKLKKDLKSAADSLKEAATTLKKTQKKKPRRRFMRLFAFAVASAIVALVLSEALRKKVLDLLFGAEEEFEYTAPPAAPDSNGAVPEASDGDSA